MAVLAVLTYVVALRFGWVEFFALSAGMLLALLLAIPFVVGGRGLLIEREVAPERVQVGESATSRLTILLQPRALLRIASASR